MRLRERLTRRGFALSAMTLASVLTQDANAVIISPVLADSTIRVATLVAAGSSLTGVASASVTTLTDGVLKAMLLAKLRSAVLGAITLALVSTSVGVLAQDAPDGPAPPIGSRPWNRNSIGYSKRWVVQLAPRHSIEPPRHLGHFQFGFDSRRAAGHHRGEQLRFQRRLSSSSVEVKRNHSHGPRRCRQSRRSPRTQIERARARFIALERRLGGSHSQGGPPADPTRRSSPRSSSDAPPRGCESWRHDRSPCRPSQVG